MTELLDNLLPVDVSEITAHRDLVVRNSVSRGIHIGALVGNGSGSFTTISASVDPQLFGPYIHGLRIVHLNTNPAHTENRPNPMMLAVRTILNGPANVPIVHPLLMALSDRFMESADLRQLARQMLFHHAHVLSESIKASAHNKPMWVKGRHATLGRIDRLARVAAAMEHISDEGLLFRDASILHIDHSPRADRTSQAICEIADLAGGPTTTAGVRRVRELTLDLPCNGVNAPEVLVPRHLECLLDESHSVLMSVRPEQSLACCLQNRPTDHSGLPLGWTAPLGAIQAASHGMYLGKRIIEPEPEDFLL